MKRRWPRPIPNAPEPGASGLFTAVTPGWFDTIGVRLLRGRDFTDTEAENKNSPEVLIIDETMAKKLFPNRDALGQHIRYTLPPSDGSPNDFTIVGIVSEHRHEVLDSEVPRRVFAPLAQAYSGGVIPPGAAGAGRSGDGNGTRSGSNCGHMCSTPSSSSSRNALRITNVVVVASSSMRTRLPMRSSNSSSAPDPGGEGEAGAVLRRKIAEFFHAGPAIDLDDAVMRVYRTKNPGVLVHDQQRPTLLEGARVELMRGARREAGRDECCESIPAASIEAKSSSAETDQCDFPLRGRGRFLVAAGFFGVAFATSVCAAVSCFVSSIAASASKSVPRQAATP